MHPRFAASLFLLGLADLAFVNLKLGPRLYTSDGSESALLLPPATRATPSDASEPVRAPSVAAPAEPTRVAERLPDPAGVAAAVAKPNNPVPGSASSAPSVAAAPPPVPAQPPSSDALAFAEQLSVPFPTASVAQLTSAAREAVLQLGLRLREHPSWRASVIGHADARGSREINLALGTARARVVARLLATAGVTAKQLTIASRGEDEPKLSGNSEEAWTANRRVEIAIRTARSDTP